MQATLKLEGPGVETTLWFDEKPEGWDNLNDVIVIPTIDKNLVMIHNRRRCGWEFPGGKIEPGESEEQAARREALEEAGVRLGRLQVFCWYLVVKGQFVHKGIIFSAPVTQILPWTDEDEVDQVQLFDMAPSEVGFKDGFAELVFSIQRGQ